MSQIGSSGSSFGRRNFDSDDIDDMTFLAHPRQGSSGYLLGDDKSNKEWEQKREKLLQERKEIEDRTLQSSKIALGVLYETEKIGCETAEDLVKQREQLNNVEEKLDSMNTTLRISQKHLTSMKSIFGGFKNYFSKSTESQPNTVNSISSNPNMKKESELLKTLDQIREETKDKSMNHPAFVNRGIDTSGFALSFEEDDKQNGNEEGENQQNSGYEKRSAVVERQLDQNLTEIDMGIGRLKHLALGLGSEIETQNGMLDRIDTKINRTNDSVNYQNRQMRQVLKK